ncbi:MAG TPA: hypothetical protein VMB50_18550 [Myxococcales bacterium]|nr:hypothetical protein [Myxococcales bacterium]
MDAGPQPLPAASLVAVWDGGTLDLRSTPDASLPPLALLRFSTAVRLADPRIRVLDDQDRMQPSHAVISSAGGGTLVTVQPTQPMSARQCCRFVVDGERQPLPLDAAGHRFLPFQVRFTVWPPPVSVASARPRHRRRHHRR